jgi:hypothetical protein
VNVQAHVERRVFFEPFDFAATLEATTKEVVAFEPRWVHVAYEGAWQGYKTGAFTFTPADLGQMVGNLRAMERFKPNCLTATKDECERHRWGVVLFDWRHLSEMDPRTVEIDNQRSFGWVLDAEVRTPFAAGDISGLKSNSDKAELWAYAYFTVEAADRINKHEVKWLSITANPNGRDKRTGQTIGWVMSSIALTNQPFLEGLTALPFQMEDDGARDGAAKGKVSMKLSKACMEWLELKNTDDAVEMSTAVERAYMSSEGMKTKHSDLQSKLDKLAKKCEEQETLCKTMEAKCAEYEKQFGALKKVASDLPAEGFGIVLAEQLVGLKKVVGAESDSLAKVGLVMADYRTAADRFQQERPKYDALLKTSAETEITAAKTDVDRVMAEKNWGEDMRPMVENYRKGAFSDTVLMSTDNGVTKVSLEALEGRKVTREAFIKQFPPTGTANVTHNFVGMHAHTPFGTIAASGAGGLNGGDGVGFGARSGFGTQAQGGPIKLEAESGGTMEVNLSHYPGFPLQQAQTALRAAQPTRWKDCYDASHGNWIAFNREATRLLEACVAAGQLKLSADLGFSG